MSRQNVPVFSSASHPIELAPLFRELVGQAFKCEFSRYIYKPQTIYDTRECFCLASDTLETAFPVEAGRLGPRQEIALHSRLLLENGDVAHIPMLDLLGDLDDYSVEMLKQCMSDFGIPRFYVYSSGRSFHVYGLGLLTPEKLVHFFGRALLLNLPEKREVVDSRWIGHRLMGEYGSLRWTDNSGVYDRLPTKVGEYRS